MKKFLSMFFMLSVLPTIGLAVDTTSTHDPYNRLDKFDKRAKDYQNPESQNHEKYHHTEQYKSMCKSLHKFTTDYNLEDKYTANDRDTQRIMKESDCDTIYHVNLGAERAAKYFLSQVSWANWQIKQKQIDIVENNCNINHGKSFYKEFGWDGGRTTVKKPTTECAATSGDNRCLLVQPLQQLPSRKPEYYYSCNQPELEFTKRDNGSLSIHVKADINTCGVKAYYNPTAGILDDRIPLTLNDFDENCQLKDDNIKKLAEGDYGSETEKETLIQEILIRR